MALTVDTVADTAMRILADFGLGDLTMRRLARELGVQPSALYWHVADKQSLFVLLAQRMAAEAERHRAPERPADTAEDPAEPSTAEHLRSVLAFRTVLLRYRESADIVILAYSLSGASVLPAGVEEIPVPCRDSVVAFMLGSIAVEQARHLLGPAMGAEHATGADSTAATDAAAAQSESAFRAGVLALLHQLDEKH